MLLNNCISLTVSFDTKKGRFRYALNQSLSIVLKKLYLTAQKQRSLHWHTKDIITQNKQKTTDRFKRLIWHPVWKWTELILTALRCAWGTWNFSVFNDVNTVWIHCNLTIKNINSVYHMLIIPVIMLYRLQWQGSWVFWWLLFIISSTRSNLCCSKL